MKVIDNKIKCVRMALYESLVSFDREAFGLAVFFVL